MPGEKPPLLILAGGKGTRLQALDATRPKSMVAVQGKPFLQWLIGHYIDLGFDRIVVSTGHMAEVIETYSWEAAFPGRELEFFCERQPLGTGGAVRATFHDALLNEAWVINGDTLLPHALPSVPSGLEALYTLITPEHAYDALPNVSVRNGRVVQSPTPEYLDAGSIFVTRKAVDRYQGTNPCSIHQLLAPSVAADLVGYVTVPGTYYDIGTPDRLKRFEDYLERRSAAR